MYKTISLFGILVLFLACIFDPDRGEHDAFITIDNMSDENIVWCSFVAQNDITGTSKSYWGDEIEDKYIVLKGNVQKHSFYSESMKSNFKNGGWQKYYLFNHDSLRTIPWERIRDERIILKEVTFNSWEEMEACGFTITYP
jgi:hypothetical protein